VSVGYWTYEEWEKHTIDKIVGVAMAVDENDREGWLRVQIKAAVRQSLAHGRSGRSDTDPIKSVVVGLPDSN
jgi:hypothetical protein